MIHTIRTVAVGDQESKIDSPIILYRGDREIEVEFTINGSKFTFTNGGNVIKSTNATHGQLVINAPTGEHMFSEVTECHDGKVVFIITKEMIDELIEVGFYSFQIRLFDESQVSRVTIPPVLKGIDIRNPIAAEDETNVVDIGLVDYAVVAKDEFEDLSTFLPDGNYNKTEWESKDVISGAKLNKIEDALYDINYNMEVSDLSILNRLEDINQNVNGQIAEFTNEANSEIEAFKRSLNNNVEQFKIDTNIAMTAHKNEVSDEIESINTQLDTIETQKANKSDLETLEVRMNNFTSLPNGSTTADAELIDARVGLQGETYNNIGEAIRRQTNILNNNEYWKLPIAYYSGGINTSGADSPNTSTTNINARSTFIHVSKGDILKVKNYCIVLFEYSGDYTFNKYTRYEDGINLVFNEDKILKFYLYKKDSSSLNTATNIGEFLNLNDQKYIDNSVSLLYVNKKDRFCYGRYVDTRINYTGDKKTIFAFPRQLKNNTSIYVNGNYKINLGSIIDGEIDSVYAFGGVSLVKTVTEGLYMMFIQKQDETPINSFDNYDIELDIIENFKNKYVDGFTKLAYHRGFSSMRAENTISAFDYVAQYGGKYVECDVEETSDGNLVILHDSTVDRTTNGTGDIRELTLAQVKELYVDAPMFVDLYNNTLRIPTFEEFLINCRKNNLTPIIEIKRAVNFTTLVNTIIKYRFENNCIVQSGNISHLLSIRNLNKNLYLCLLAEKYSSSTLNGFTRLGKNAGVNMHINATSTTYIKRFQDLNGFFASYVSDDYTEMEGLSEWGCDFILTNRLLNNGNNLYNFKVENLYYSSEGKSVDYTIPYNETSLFSDVIHITAQVYCDTNALLTIGDKTLTIGKSKEWNYIDLKFIQKVSGNINIKLECNDENFRHILFKVKRYCGDLI